MNRHERRRSKRSKKIRFDQIDKTCDIQVDAKREQVVMIYANDAGRKRVEEVFPDVRWDTDEKFASGHPSDWLFTHVRVTKLPCHLEEQIPLAFATPDALGFAVTIALQRGYTPCRVLHWSGEGHDVKTNMYNTTTLGAERGLFAEYVPAGTELGMPPAVN